MSFFLAYFAALPLAHFPKLASFHTGYFIHFLRRKRREEILIREEGSPVPQSTLRAILGLELPIAPIALL